MDVHACGGRVQVEACRCVHGFMQNGVLGWRERKKLFGPTVWAGIEAKKKG